MRTKNGEKLLYEDISYIIRGVCFDLYKQFGGIFKESIINNALKKELKSKGLKVEAQKRIDILYKDEKVGVYVPDLIIEDKIIIELKTKQFLTKEDERQFWYYLKCSEYKLGFLINFGSRELQIKRRIYDKARENIRVNPLLQHKNPRQSASTKGFTMVELLVAMSLFIIFVVIASGSFIRALRTQRAIVALIAANDNASLSLEQMAREIRTGTNFSSSANSNLTFANAKGIQITYQLNSETKTIERGEEGANFKPITATNVKINKLNFYLRGQQAGDGYSPRITIVLNAAPNIPTIQNISTNFQTTVSARLLDT